MVHGRDGAAVSQVAGDEAKVLEWTAKEGGRLLCRIAVTRAVGAVAADAIVLVVSHG